MRRESQTRTASGRPARYRTLERFPGLVVRTTPSGDADVILRVVTTGHGKRALIAKNARRGRSAFPGGLEVFDRGDFEARTRTEGSELATVASFRPTVNRRPLRESLERMVVASCLCEVVDVLTAEDAPDNDRTFPVLDAALDDVAAATTPAAMLTILCDALGRLLLATGFGGAETDGPATPRRLARFLSDVEAVAEKPLLSRGEVDRLAARVRKSTTPEGTKDGNVDPRL